MTLIRSDAIYALPRSIAGTMIPDSKLAREVTELVKDTEPPLLFHHSSRVYYWGAHAVPGHLGRYAEMPRGGEAAEFDRPLEDGHAGRPVHGGAPGEGGIVAYQCWPPGSIPKHPFGIPEMPG